MKPPWRAVWRLTALWLAAGCGSGAGPAGPPGDILLLTVDTLRPDHLSLYGYERRTSPGLDRLFADGLIYERAYATHASTPQSVVSLLSGALPQEHGVRDFFDLVRDDVRLVPDRLPDRYQSAAFVSNAVLTDEALGIAARFDHYDDFVDERESRREGVYERSARRTTDAALAWLDAGRDLERPVFLWVHWIDPHGPYRPPPDAETRFESSERRPIPEKRIPGYLREPGVLDGNAYVAAYDAEVAYTDREVARLLDGYAARHPLDEALVIFTADHGESMMEHALWFTHGYHVYDEIVRVPLALRGPGVVAGRSRALVSGTDVAPTLLRFAGVAVDGDGSRADLRRPASLDPDRAVFTEASLGRPPVQVRAAVQGDTKWVVFVPPDPSKPGRRSSFDLARDPGELRSEPWREGGGAERLLALIEADPDARRAPLLRPRGKALAGPKRRRELSAKQRRQLEALGYVEPERSEGGR